MPRGLLVQYREGAKAFIGRQGALERHLSATRVIALHTTAPKEGQWLGGKSRPAGRKHTNSDYTRQTNHASGPQQKPPQNSCYLPNRCETLRLTSWKVGRWLASGWRQDGTKSCCPPLKREGRGRERKREGGHGRGGSQRRKRLQLQVNHGTGGDLRVFSTKTTVVTSVHHTRQR